MATICGLGKRMEPMPSVILASNSLPLSSVTLTRRSHAMASTKWDPRFPGCAKKKNVLQILVWHVFEWLMRRLLGWCECCFMIFDVTHSTLIQKGMCNANAMTSQTSFSAAPIQVYLQSHEDMKSYNLWGYWIHSNQCQNQMPPRCCQKDLNGVEVTNTETLEVKRLQNKFISKLEKITGSIFPPKIKTRIFEAQLHGNKIWPA